MEKLQQFQGTHNGQLNQDPELTIHDYWLIINRGKFWIIFSVLIVLIFTVYYNYSVAPEYTASSTLLIKTNSDATAIFDFGGGMSQSQIANQIELNSSFALITVVILISVLAEASV